MEKRFDSIIKVLSNHAEGTLPAPPLKSLVQSDDEVDDGYDERMTTSSSQSDGPMPKPIIPGSKFSPEMVRKYGVSGMVWRPEVPQPRKYSQQLVKPSLGPNLVADSSVPTSTEQIPPKPDLAKEDKPKFKYNLKTTPAYQLFGPSADAKPLPENSGSSSHENPEVKQFYTKMKDIMPEDTVAYAQINHKPFKAPEKPAVSTTSTQTVTPSPDLIPTASPKCYHHPVVDPTKVVELDPVPNNLKINPLHLNNYTLYSKFLRKSSQQYDKDLTFGNFMFLPSDEDEVDLDKIFSDKPEITEEHLDRIANK